MIRTQVVLDSWRTIRKDTVQAVLDFPVAAFDEHPVADLMTFREIARHILDAGQALSGVLLDGVEDLAAPGFRPSLKKYTLPVPPDADPAALADALETSLDSRIAELTARDSDFYAHEITRFDGQRVTRLEMLQFVKEHELTHRAQLFMFLRLKGIVPSTTRRRIADRQKA